MRSFIFYWSIEANLNKISQPPSKLYASNKWLCTCHLIDLILENLKKTSATFWKTESLIYVNLTTLKY